MDFCHNIALDRRKNRVHSSTFQPESLSGKGDRAIPILQKWVELGVNNFYLSFDGNMVIVKMVALVTTSSNQSLNLLYDVWFLR